jgi:hypothetical protein
MREAQGQHSARLSAAIALSGAGAVLGWSAGAGSGVGLGVGLAAATVALATTARRRTIATAPGETALATDQAGWREVQRELDRGRRHERPFVLIRIPTSAAGALGNGHTPGAADPESLGRSLRAFLRSIDFLWVSDGHLYLLLPESSRAMGEAFLSRVRATAPHLLSETDMVAFPEDGVTGGALLALLHGRTVPRHTIPLTPDPDRIRMTS